MDTVVDKIRSKGLLIRNLLQELQTHSSIERWYNPQRSDQMVWAGSPFKWNLDDGGRQIQANVLEQYRRFHSLVSALLSQQPRDTLEDLKQADAQILEIIEQKEGPYTPEARKHFDRALGAIEVEIGLLDRLYGQADETPILIPDTNALIFNPDIEKWKFDRVPRFVIVLVPGVTSDLDKFKLNHRVENVRTKSEKLIRQIKEYRRRATAANRTLEQGASLISGVSEIRSIAVEPQMNASLPWLDPTNADDKILASVIEVMRTNPRSPVFLVTRDFNLQNKADLAGVSFLEPPDLGPVPNVAPAALKVRPFRWFVGQFSAALLLAGCSEIVLFGMRKILFEEIALTGKVHAEQLSIIGICTLMMFVVGRFIAKLSWFANASAILILTGIEFFRIFGVCNLRV